MPPISWPVLAAIVVVMSGLGSAAGIWVAIKITVARLETWRAIDAGNITVLQRDVSILQEDSLVHDMEIGGILQRQGTERVRRQVARG